MLYERKIVRDQIKDAYLQGLSIDEICTTLGITRGNFYYHKKEDLKKGINWDTLALNKERDTESIKDKEARFLKTLIISFEKFIDKSDELEPETIEKLHKYAETYWKLKAPQKNDAFASRKQSEDIARKTIEGIAKLALSEENKAVVEFLSQNAELIIQTIFKEYKNG